MKEFLLPPQDVLPPSAIDLAHQAIAIYGWKENQRAQACTCNGCKNNSLDLTDWIFDRNTWAPESALRIRHKIVHSSHTDDEPPFVEEYA